MDIAKIWGQIALKTPFIYQNIKRFHKPAIGLPPPPKNIVKLAITPSIGNTKSYKTLLQEKQNKDILRKSIFTNKRYRTNKNKIIYLYPS